MGGGRPGAGRPRSAGTRAWKEKDDGEPISSGRDRGCRDGGRQCCAGAALCQANIAQVLSEYGVKFGDVVNPTWQTLRWAHPGDANGPVSGYQFYGRPASCSRQSLRFGHHRLRNLQHAYRWWLHDQGHSEPLVVTGKRPQAAFGNSGGDREMLGVDASRRRRTADYWCCTTMRNVSMPTAPPMGFRTPRSAHSASR